MMMGYLQTKYSKQKTTLNAKMQNTLSLYTTGRYS